MSDGIFVLGLDPGFKHIGWAVVRLLPDAERLVDLGVIRTDKAKNKGLLVSDDLHRRGQEIVRALALVLAAYPFVAVCAESISYPRNASVCGQLGRGWGIIDTLLELRGLALICASPQAIKKAATGKASASKEAVLDALDKRFDGTIRARLRHIKATALHEHPVDAVGAVVASRHHDHLRLAERARQQTVWGSGIS